MANIWNGLQELEPFYKQHQFLFQAGQCILFMVCAIASPLYLNYVGEKAKNRAIKQDLAEMTQIAKNIESKIAIVSERQIYVSKERFDYEYKAYQNLWETAFVWFNTYNENSLKIANSINIGEIDKAKEYIQIILSKGKEYSLEIRRFQPFIGEDVFKIANSLQLRDNKLQNMRDRGVSKDDFFEYSNYMFSTSKDMADLIFKEDDGLQAAMRKRLAEFEK